MKVYVDVRNGERKREREKLIRSHVLGKWIHVYSQVWFQRLIIFFFRMVFERSMWDSRTLKKKKKKRKEQHKRIEKRRKNKLSIKKIEFLFSFLFTYGRQFSLSLDVTSWVLHSHVLPLNPGSQKQRPQVNVPFPLHNGLFGTYGRKKKKNKQ